MSRDLLPCEANARIECATCSLHNNGCPIEVMCGVVGAYEIVKAMNPIHTTPKAGANVQELVKGKFPKLYNGLRLAEFNWQNDLDGILDFLYGERDIGIVSALLSITKAELTELIKFIEKNCEVRRG